MSFRYIGSKARVVLQIANYLGASRGRTFVDVFCGTGAVAEVAAEQGWKVRLNDHLISATTMAEARLLSSADAPFAHLGGYEAAVARLNNVRPIEGFIWREYSPASFAKVGVERRYFTESNAGRIDAARAQIEAWHSECLITNKERTLLIADLLAALNRVANIAGTYGCFLAKWTPQSAGSLELRPRERKAKRTAIEISNLDAVRVKVNSTDLVYLDPPYTKRQYASYYHILETVTLGDEPVVEGVAGLRPWKKLASDYCYKVRALNTLCELISRLPARHILLSYSNEGHIDLTDLMLNLDEVGKVRMHELARIGRYRPNTQASANRASVNEYLIEIEKKSVVQDAPLERLAFV